MRALFLHAGTVPFRWYDRATTKIFLSRHRFLVRCAIGGIWLFHGLFGKVLGLIPRHRLIVGRVLGDSHAAWATPAIGVLEILLALWVVSGRWPRLCAGVITLALASMNTLEIAFAKDLLLAPAWMVAANLVLCAAAWAVAT